MHQKPSFGLRPRREPAILAPVDDDRTGQLIGGLYLVERQLGRGAFGIVWLCRSQSDNQYVVLKILHAQWARVPTVVERFRREGQVGDRVNHPHVAQIFGFSTTEDGIPYIAMEYLTGGTLKDELKQHGALSPARAAEIWAPVCDAVAAAHQAGIVHRDLKPENVMLTTRGGNSSFPVVLDFGIAKFRDAAEKLTSTGTMLGTPTYMAPEQCRGQQDLGPPADVYALGAITFEILSGGPPFKGKTVAELAMKHLLDPAPPLTGAPPALAEIVARCLAKEADKRPGASALAEALRKAARAQSARVPVIAAAAGAGAPAAAQSSAAATVVPGRLAPAVVPKAAAATVVSGKAPSGSYNKVPARPGVAPPSSIASTVMMGNAQVAINAEIARRHAAMKPSGPPMAVLIAVGVAVLAVGGLITALLLR
ncbi:MAG: serine/threonine protein kinase [Myxococcales bacterium]|nr:serine/threonine protein kinase [Myxococcales bacterium]